MPGPFDTNKPNPTNTVPFRDICEAVDSQMDAPIPAYEFRGRVFKEQQNKPYEPSE
jgi:hypothetical protein